MCGCATAGAGHNVLAVQQIVAAASPSAWRDGIVTAVSGRNITIVDIYDGTEVTLWHHDALALAIGEPVASHSAAGLLAAAGRELNVRGL